MTINKAIAKADELRPNAYGDEDKYIWVNQVERTLQQDVYKQETVRFYKYPDDGDTPLSLPEAWSDIYVLYICSMCDFWEQDTAKYNASAALYNARWEAFRKEYARSNVRSSAWKNLI